MDVSTRTIERWFKLGLEQTKAGGKVYTSRSALQRFAMRNAIQCGSSEPQREGMSQADRDATAYLESIGIS